jgi:hypothetical protein
MRRLALLMLLALCACNTAPSPAPVINACVVPVKTFTDKQQEQLFEERMRLRHGTLVDLTAHGQENVSFPITVMVMDDWARMRLGLRAAHGE